jgi:hypothetical protein
MADGFAAISSISVNSDHIANPTPLHCGDNVPRPYNTKTLQAYSPEGPSSHQSTNYQLPIYPVLLHRHTLGQIPWLIYIRVSHSRDAELRHLHLKFALRRKKA